MVFLGYHKVSLISDFFNFSPLSPSAENLTLRRVKEHKDSSLPISFETQNTQFFLMYHVFSWYIKKVRYSFELSF